VNALGLVGVCYGGDIIDKAVVERTFRNTFITLYEEINQLPDLPGLHKNGPKLLSENRAAMRLL